MSSERVLPTAILTHNFDIGVEALDGGVLHMHIEEISACVAQGLLEAKVGVPMTPTILI